MPNDFLSDEGKELLGKVWVELADSSEMPQTADLRGFPSLIARGKSVLGFQFADRAGGRSDAVEIEFPFLVGAGRLEPGEANERHHLP